MRTYHCPKHDILEDRIIQREKNVLTHRQQQNPIHHSVKSLFHLSLKQNDLLLLDMHFKVTTDHIQTFLSTKLSTNKIKLPISIYAAQKNEW